MIRDKIIIVEDDPGISKYLQAALRSHGYDILLAPDGKTALEMIASHCPDLLLLDLGLPDMDGSEIIRSVRAWSRMPIIIISARSAEIDKAAALDMGADDYLTKPFLMQELLLRVQHLLQRAYRTELSRTKAAILQLGDRSVDLHDALVTLPDGTTLALTATERTLLRKLAENRGHIVTYDALCEAVWGADYYGYENSLGVHIRHLREKLEPEPGRPRFLQTVRGIGYKLAKEDAR